MFLVRRLLVIYVTVETELSSSAISFVSVFVVADLRGVRAQDSLRIQECMQCSGTSRVRNNPALFLRKLRNVDILRINSCKCIVQFYYSVYSNIGYYRRPPPLPSLGTGSGRHDTVVQCVVLQ